MNTDRREPNLGRYEDVAGSERIPTLKDIVTPDSDTGPRETARTQSEATGKRAGPPLKPSAPTPPIEEPQLSLSVEEIPALDPADYDFIDELARTEPASGPTRQLETGAVSATPEPAPEDIEAIADRVLDQIAPVLREAVAAAVQDLLARRGVPRR